MNILDLPEDHVMQCMKTLDVMSFVIFMSSCKYLYNSRFVYMKFVECITQYEEYGISPFLYLNSYINMDSFKNKEDKITMKLPSKLDYTRTKNTMNIVGFYATEWSEIYDKDARLRFSIYSDLLEMCCKAVCQKYRYKYSKPYHRLYRTIWSSIQWKTCCLNIVDLCEIIYHIKNRRYPKLYNTLCNLQFRAGGYKSAVNTVQYITDYAKYETNHYFKSVLIYLIYTYVGMNNNLAMFPKTFQDVIMVKASEHIEYIKDMSMFPKYLRKFMIEKIESVKT
jgi:hypothetical protein